MQGAQRHPGARQGPSETALKRPPHTVCKATRVASSLQRNHCLVWWLACGRASLSGNRRVWEGWDIWPPHSGEALNRGTEGKVLQGPRSPWRLPPTPPCESHMSFTPRKVYGGPSRRAPSLLTPHTGTCTHSRHGSASTCLSLGCHTRHTCSVSEAHQISFQGRQAPAVLPPNKAGS